MRQRATGSVVAVRQHVAEVSGRESVQHMGKFHTGFAKSSVQVLGRKRAS